MEGLQVLPLAIAMMLGPQIVSAIIFVTTPRAVRVSLGFLAGVALAATVGTAVMRGLAALLGSAVDLGSSTDNSPAGQIIQYVLVGLLAAAALKSWLGRATAEPPTWMRTLMSADPGRAFKVGLLVVLVMPSDLLIMLTVGANLETNGASFAEALPFIALTVLVAALPLLVLLLFHKRAETAMPRVRDWVNTHSWLVNIIVYVIFTLIIL